MTAVGSYIPEGRVSNLALASAFDLDEKFIRQRLGFVERAQARPDETNLSMCLAAFANLQKKLKKPIEDIQCLLLVTQNPDYTLPPVSTLLHGALGLKTSCAAWDVSLGCSGYVYGLAQILSFMEAQDLREGLLFTSDSYRKIVDPNDKDTALIFGDAATVTYISEDYLHSCSAFDFGTQGSEADKLIVRDGRLFMDGRGVFNFAAQNIPLSIENSLKKKAASKEDADFILVHQGSRFIVQTIAQRLGLSGDKVPFAAGSYGNTVSSSVPLLLEDKLNHSTRLVLSGYGLGLSWASCVTEARVNR